MLACLMFARNPITVFLTFLLLASGAQPGIAGARIPAWNVASQMIHSLPGSVDAACLSEIPFGETLECFVESEGERHTYTFTAAVNDEIKVRMTRLDGMINPAVHILSPAGSNLCSAFTSDNIAEIGHCTIPEPGTYTLIAEDTYRTNTGSYNLYAQRLNNPGNARTITFGQSLPGAIDLAAEIDTYTFKGAANSLVKVRMTRTANNLRSRIRIYDLDGINICSAFSSGEAAEIGGCELPRGGSYTILADDTGSRTGSYTLSLECVAAPCTLATPQLYLPLVANLREHAPIQPEHSDISSEK